MGRPRIDGREARKRMRRLRRRVLGHDVSAWSAEFLEALRAGPGAVLPAREELESAEYPRTGSEQLEQGPDEFGPPDQTGQPRG